MAHVYDSTQQSNKYHTSFGKEILPGPCRQKQKQPEKYMWKAIDKVLHKSSGTAAISELRGEDVIVKNEIQLIEKLNKHFVNIGPELARKLEGSPDDDPIKYINSVDVNHKLSFKTMNEEAMLASLMMLKGGKAPGPDGVPTIFVKDAAKSIGVILASFHTFGAAPFARRALNIITLSLASLR